MTYQKTFPNNDNAEEASSLLTIVTASPAPALAFGQHEGGDVAPATKKKNGGVPRRLMIATSCILLVTLAVLYGGRGRSSSSHTRSGGSIAADLLRGHTQAPEELYAPGG